MSILADVKELLEPLNVPIATGVYKGTATDTYLVLVPMSDTFELHADNMPNAEVQELRVSIYTKVTTKTNKSNSKETIKCGIYSNRPQIHRLRN